MDGHCHLCGKFGKLTFEHFPPESTGNNTPVRISNLLDVINSDPEDRIKGKQSQRGFGKHCLCESCNNYMGSNYVKPYINWFEFGKAVIKASREFQRINCDNISLEVLGIFKLVIGFFVDGDQTLTRDFPTIKSFLLDRESKGFPDNIKVYCYATNSGKIKNYPRVHSLFLGTENKNLFFSEFVHPPFGYLILFDGIISDPRLLEITGFSKAEYGKQYPTSLVLYNLPTISNGPFDFRNADRIRAESEMG